MNWVDTLLSPLKESVALKLDDFIISFKEYLPQKYKQVGLVRTIVDIYKNVPIDTVYVSSNFLDNSTSISEDELFQRIESGEAFTIEGFGGSGKSIFMRHLWRSLAKRGSSIPILVELRNIDLSKGSLTDFIVGSCFGEARLSTGQFEMLLGDGRFTVLLDGFDELGQNDKRNVEREIIKLSEHFSKTSIVVTGRPDERFSSWGRFQTLKVAPFTFSQFSELINKIDFDPDSKRSFQNRADEDFFNLHREFLSNPLLALMMLVSFGENAEIPSRLSVFYRQCFDALFRKHDAMKQAYERQRTLDQLEFERFFSVFSFLSHQDKKTSFGDNYFHRNISDSMEYLGIPEEKRSGIEIDVLEAVNLLAKEGDFYFYIHRSFQEYFAARCVTTVMVNEVPQALSFFADDTNSTAFRLCCEMHEDLVKEKYLIPEYERLRHLFPTECPDDHPLYVADVQGCSGEIGVHLWATENGEKFAELNGWMFNSAHDVDKLYRCAANVGDKGGALNEARFELSIEVPKPLCNAVMLSEIKRAELVESGRVLISIQGKDLRFVIDGIVDPAGISAIEVVLDRERHECMKSLLKLNEILLSFNQYLESNLKRRESSRKLLIRSESDI